MGMRMIMGLDWSIPSAAQGTGFRLAPGVWRIKGYHALALQ